MSSTAIWTMRLKPAVVLSAPSAYLLSLATMTRLRRSYKYCHGVQISDGGSCQASEDAMHRGALAPSLNIAWAMVATQQTSTGRPTLQSLGGLPPWRWYVCSRTYQPIAEPSSFRACVPQEPRTPPSRHAIRLKV
ncbi:MAG: hypothetical protein R3C68_11985 [Myxococcota bacterium]